MKVKVYGYFDSDVIVNTPLITIYVFEGNYYCHLSKKGKITGFSQINLQHYKRDPVRIFSEVVEKEVGDSPYVFYKKMDGVLHFSLDNIPEELKSRLANLLE